MSQEQRRHQRFPVELRVKIRFEDQRFEDQDVEAYTSLVAKEGMSVRLQLEVALESEVKFIIYLPDGNALLGEGTCLNVLVGGICGFSVLFDAAATEKWESFIEQEAQTGSLWRMINRYRQGGSAGSAREVVVNKASAPGIGEDSQEQNQLRFHTVGENGEAYRVIFERCASTIGFESNLMALPGFDRLAERAVERVLDENVVIRQAEHAPVQSVRVVELRRGGFAFVQGDERTATGLVSLGLGELILIAADEEIVFPNFTELELERIACDTFRSDIVAPIFGPATTSPSDSATKASASKGAPDPVVLDAFPMEGVDAIFLAQGRATQVQRRQYAGRTLELYPQIWARSRQGDGFDVMGPTMRDGDRALVLVLVGSGAPRVLRLDDHDDVKLMQH